MVDKATFLTKNFFKRYLYGDNKLDMGYKSSVVRSVKDKHEHADVTLELEKTLLTSPSPSLTLTLTPSTSHPHSHLYARA